jgi:hypothetical protein
MPQVVAMEKPNRPDSTPAPGDFIGAAAADFEAAIAEISVDPRDIPRGAINPIRATRYPTLDRERQAATLVRSFLESITERFGTMIYPLSDASALTWESAAAD